MSEWISVEDQKIPPNTRTLQLCPNGTQGSDRHKEYEQLVKAVPANRFLYGATHWMPLPPNPTEGENND